MIIQYGIFALNMRIWVISCWLLLVPLTSVWGQKKGKLADNLSDAQVEELMTEGMRHFMKDDFDESILIWEHLLQEKKDNPTIYYFLAKAYLALDKPVIAFQNAKEANRISPYSMDYGLFFVDLALESKKLPEAIVALNKLLEYDGTQPELNLRLAQAYLWNEQGDKALECLEKADAFIGDYPEIIRTKQSILLKKGELQLAINEGARLLLESPEEILFDWNQLLSLWELQKGAGLNRFLHELNLRFPDQGQINVLKAHMYLQEKNLDSTLVEIKLAATDARTGELILGQLSIQALELIKSDDDWLKTHQLMLDLQANFPEEPRFFALEGDLWIRNSKFAEAQNLYVKAARLGNSKFEVWSRIVQLDFEMNLLDSAIVHSDEALAIFPNQGFLYFQKGFAQFLKGQILESIDSFEAAIPLITEKEGWYAELYGLLGDAYHAQKRFFESDDSFDRVLKRKPADEHVLNNYSYYLSLRKEKLDKAAEMSKKLIEKYPTNSTYLDTHAWVLFQMQDYVGALKYLEVAMMDEKQISSTVWEHYGDVLFKMGRAEDALKAWKTAYSMEGASSNVEKKIQMKQMIEN